MKIPVYLKDGKTVETTDNGTERMIHALDARKMCAVNPAWVFMTETQKVNGYDKVVSLGIRPKTEADIKADRARTKVALQNAERAVELAKKAEEAFGTTTVETPVDKPEGGRKAPARRSTLK